jgi:hypothetical protein
LRAPAWRCWIKSSIWGTYAILQFDGNLDRAGNLYDVQQRSIDVLTFGPGCPAQSGPFLCWRRANITAVQIKEAPITWRGARGFKFWFETGGGHAHVRPHEDYARLTGPSKRGRSCAVRRDAVLAREATWQIGPQTRHQKELQARCTFFAGYGRGARLQWKSPNASQLRQLISNLRGSREKS